MTLALQNKWQNRRAEAADDAVWLSAEFFLEDCGAWTRYPRRSRAEAVTHGVLSGTAPEPCAMLTPQGGGAWRTTVRRAQDVPKLYDTSVLLLSLARRERRPRDLASCRRLTGRTERRRDPASPPNGLEVNPRGQGPRGYGSAARRMPACKSRGAGGVPPSKYR